MVEDPRLTCRERPGAASLEVGSDQPVTRVAVRQCSRDAPVCSSCVPLVLLVCSCPSLVPALHHPLAPPRPQLPPFGHEGPFCRYRLFRGFPGYTVRSGSAGNGSGVPSVYPRLAPRRPRWPESLPHRERNRRRVLPQGGTAVDLSGPRMGFAVAVLTTDRLRAARSAPPVEEWALKTAASE